MFAVETQKVFILPLILSIVATVLFALLLPPLQGAIASAFLFLAIFVFTVVMMKICFQEPWHKLIFCAIAGYTAQHIAAQFFELSVLIMGLTPTQDFNYAAGSNPMAYIPLFNFGSGQMPIAGNPFIFVYYVFLFGHPPKRNTALSHSDKNFLILIKVSFIIYFCILQCFCMQEKSVLPDGKVVLW